MTNRTVTGICPFVLFLVLALSFPAQAGLISESSVKPGNPSSGNSPETGLTGKTEGLEGTDPFDARGTRRAESKAIKGSAPPPLNVSPLTKCKEAIFD